VCLCVLQGLIPAVRTSTSRSVLANAKAQLLMALQDEDVGAVLGKKGQTLTQIQQVNAVWGGVGERGGGGGGLCGRDGEVGIDAVCEVAWVL
jgi:predicted RNA-binding protein YlqC (UPF0109 family)